LPAGGITVAPWEKNTMWHKLLFGLALTVATCASHAEPAKEASVRQLIRVTGAGEMGKQMIDTMIPELRKMLPQAPEAFWTEFTASVDVNELVNLIVPVYQKHYSEEDIQAALKFFESDAGKRMIQKQPQIMQESFVAGQQWGQLLAQRAIEKLNAQTEKEGKTPKGEQAD
jgi:hypothetical protein